MMKEPGVLKSETRKSGLAPKKFPRGDASRQIWSPESVQIASGMTVGELTYVTAA